MRKYKIQDEEKFYSIEKRKELAKKYNLGEQMLIDMSREQFMAFVIGAVEGEKVGAMKALAAYEEDIKNGFQARVDAVEALINEALEEDTAGELDTNLLDDIMAVLKGEAQVENDEGEADEGEEETV